MRVQLEQLGNDAPIWIFGISPALDRDGEQALLRDVDAFLDRWASHGAPIRAARELRDGSFLIIAADAASEKSGCSIDRLFGTLRSLEQQLGVTILDSNRVFYRDADADTDSIRAVARGEFRNAATADTEVFDLTAERLGDVRTGTWQRRAAESWHRQLL
ncbi:MAG: hypothetical protein JO197_04415 [Acidobacteria bacterium]|nr:hypothetical protein [Acidobacteriota bacterium]MBV9478541.1 hypothetical protein [Acidobacteriota bacterium]